MMAQEDLRAVHAQTAIVRTLVDELKREGAVAGDAPSVRAQAMEESNRLVSTLEKVVRHRSEAPPPAPPEALPPKLPAAAKRARVLIVEDDDASRHALACCFSSVHDVVTARDGLEGLAVANATQPDVVITDVRMPRMDGLTMVARLREAGPLQNVPVIFVTGEGTPELVVRGLATGHCSYWVKPLDLGLIASELQSVLSDRCSGTGRT